MKDKSARKGIIYEFIIYMKKTKKLIQVNNSTFNKKQINSRLQEAGVTLARDRKCLTTLVQTVIGQIFDYDTLTERLSENMPRFIYLKHKHGFDEWEYGGRVGCYYFPCDNSVQHKLPRGKSLFDYDLEEWDNLPTVEAGPQDIGIGYIEIEGRGLRKYRQETFAASILQPEKVVARFRQFQVTKITVDFDFFSQDSKRLRLIARLDRGGDIFITIEEVKFF